MIYGQGLDRKAMMLLLSCITLFCVLQGTLCVARTDEDGREHLYACGLRYILWGILCCEVICEIVCLGVEDNRACVCIFLSIFGGCMLMACITDVESCVVYDYVWWISGCAGLFLAALAGNEKTGSLILFGLLQEMFFCKMYGRADCHAFWSGSVMLSAFGMDMKGYLVHMLMAFGLLAVVQVFRHNVGRDGKLKRPIPFLPYITISFWMLMLLYVLHKGFV